MISFERLPRQTFTANNYEYKTKNVTYRVFKWFTIDLSSLPSFRLNKTKFLTYPKYHHICSKVQEGCRDKLDKGWMKSVISKCSPGIPLICSYLRHHDQVLNSQPFDKFHEYWANNMTPKV